MVPVEFALAAWGAFAEPTRDHALEATVIQYPLRHSTGSLSRQGGSLTMSEAAFDTVSDVARDVRL
jgi:hypothetical protein